MVRVVEKSKIGNVAKVETLLDWGGWKGVR